MSFAGQIHLYPHFSMAKIFFYLLLFKLHRLLSASEVEQAGFSNTRDHSEPKEDCICVPFYQCADDEVVYDESGIIDSRYKSQDKELGMEEKYVPPGCGPYHVCCHSSEALTVHPYEHRCGTRNPGGINERILTTDEPGRAQFGEWPWMVAMFDRSGGRLDLECGGSLIDERHVLTTAACGSYFQNNMSNAVIRLGEWDRTNADEFMPHEDYDVEEIMIHPAYHNKTFAHDIAVLKLSRDVIFKPHIDTACLPRHEDDFTGENCIATGWGKDRSNRMSMIMKEMSVTVLSHDECQNMWRRTSLGKNFKLHKSVLCVGSYEDDGPCFGDGGSPVVCYRSDNTYSVAGISSWGMRCGQPEIPESYVNVSKYINWIAAKTGKPLEYYWSMNRYDAV